MIETDERERYIILDVEYLTDEWGQSLGWIAPTLKDEPGLTLTEDYESEAEGCAWHRKWAGTISESTYEKLANDWNLDPEDSEPNLGMLTEYGHLESLAFDFDGMDWNAGGETPIAYASLRVSIYREDAS
jgi:hypothetical protein